MEVNSSMTLPGNISLLNQIMEAPKELLFNIFHHFSAPSLVRFSMTLTRTAKLFEKPHYYDLLIDVLFQDENIREATKLIKYLTPEELFKIKFSNPMKIVAISGYPGCVAIAALNPKAQLSYVTEDFATNIAMMAYRNDFFSFQQTKYETLNIKKSSSNIFKLTQAIDCYWTARYIQKFDPKRSKKLFKSSFKILKSIKDQEIEFSVNKVLYQILKANGNISLRTSYKIALKIDNKYPHKLSALTFVAKKAVGVNNKIASKLLKNALELNENFGMSHYKKSHKIVNLLINLHQQKGFVKIKLKIMEYLTDFCHSSDIPTLCEFYKFYSLSNQPHKAAALAEKIKKLLVPFINTETHLASAVSYAIKVANASIIVSKDFKETYLFSGFDVAENQVGKIVNPMKRVKHLSKMFNIILRFDTEAAERIYESAMAAIQKIEDKTDRLAALSMVLKNNILDWFPINHKVQSNDLAGRFVSDQRNLEPPGHKATHIKKHTGY